jgi:cytochrome c553
MARDPDRPKLGTLWPRIGWGTMAGLFIVFFLIGFFVLGRFQQNGPLLGSWAAFCRAVGLTANSAPASEPQPPRRTPTRIAWTRETLARIGSGNQKHGAIVALTCAGCHGPHGVSSIALFPTLAGMNSEVIYKQLDDFRSSKRLWGAMNAIASALSEQDFADVAAYFAHQSNGLRPVVGEGVPESGRSLRQHEPSIRLVFAGDPEREIPPCAACHGPDGQKLGAPPLQGQHREYIERQLAAFAQGMRQNDINEQMRVIAHELTPEEMHALALYYGVTHSQD